MEVAVTIWNNLRPQQTVNHFDELPLRNRNAFLKAAAEAIDKANASRPTDAAEPS
jgi:hypothetical protein